MQIFSIYIAIGILFITPPISHASNTGIATQNPVEPHTSNNYSGRNVIQDPYATTFIGKALHARIKGRIHQYDIVTKDGKNQSETVTYIHSMNPINWNPGTHQPNANIGLYFHPLFHIYDIQVVDNDTHDLKKLSKTNNCVTITGTLRTNQLHAAPIVGPEQLRIEVTNIAVCRSP